MKFITVFVSCLIGLCFASSLKGIIEPFGIGQKCLQPSSNSGVKCVSKTQFVFNYQDVRDPPLTCPTGTVCTFDAYEICTATGDPACINDLQGSKGACNACYTDPLLGNSPVCVNKTHYSFCANGKVVTTMIYPCQSPTPNCKASFDTTVPPKVNGICTAQTTGLDCNQ